MFYAKRGGGLGRSKKSLSEKTEVSKKGGGGGGSAVFGQKAKNSCLGPWDFEIWGPNLNIAVDAIDRSSTFPPPPPVKVVVVKGQLKGPLFYYPPIGGFIVGFGEYPEHVKFFGNWISVIQYRGCNKEED